jgi:hypothetical protein
MKKLLMSAVAVSLLAGQAMALEVSEEPHAGYKEVGAHKDWVAVYTPSRSADEGRVCAIYSRPTQSAVYDGEKKVEAIRGELAVFVNWNAETPDRNTGEVSFLIGDRVVEGIVEGGHSLTIDGKTSVTLAGVADRLYVQPEDDAKVLAALRGGSSAVVSAELENGTKAKDSYSLMGLTRSTAIAQSGCK